MKQNFKLIIEYDGTGFYGWQRQKKEQTIQGELEKVLSLILNQEIHIHGSGRTDAGVHALGQVAHFHANTRISPPDLKKGVNSLIKHAIVIQECHPMPNEFHARYNALSKEYLYHILNQPNACAIGRDYLWHIRQPLDLGNMNICSDLLVGPHDFKSFENTGSPRSSSVREVFSAQWVAQTEGKLVFRISASGFLKNMVRNLVGTLINVGLGKVSPEEFEQILLSCDRALASATAPARGLFLNRVIY